MAFTSLNHHLDLDLLKEAYRRTRKDGAVGINGQSAEEYAMNLEVNLKDLLERAKSGSYQAPPVRRVYIPKGGGRGLRPIGIPTFEDKVLQRAVAMILEAVYEPLFRDCSYGFRPGRSAHQALAELWTRSTRVGGGWILELDIRSYFDTIDHQQLRNILGKRVRDGVLLRLIGKWLKAGVMEDGQVHRPDSGSPQGGVISPLLSNVYLHEVLDSWFGDEVVPRLRGQAYLVRYADDAIIGFALAEDANRVLEVLPKRFARFGLTLHPEKTRLVKFRKPTGGHLRRRPRTETRTFDFLGFTHYWGVSRRGQWSIRRSTAKDRFRRAMAGFAVTCRRIRHRPIPEQHATLNKRLRGHYGYFGITGNSPALRQLWRGVSFLWYKWLRRRAQQRTLSWGAFARLLARFPMAFPRIVHQYGT